MHILTLREFSQAGWKHIADLAHWWMRITDTEISIPLFEIKNGSLFVFENKTLPRVGWDEFRQMSLSDRFDLLRCGAAVLTADEVDTFLVRLPQDFTDDGGGVGR